VTLLSVRGVSKRFGGLQAVNDLSFDVARGSIKALIGPNGAGKTTLFDLISGFLRPDRGEIFFEEAEIHAMSSCQVAVRGMVRTFQHIRLFPKMSVLENIMVGRHVHSNAGFLAGMLNLPFTWGEERRIREKSFEIMESLGIAAHARTEAASLAYGLQRVVEIGRALACEPKLLLLDEPAAGLNMRETNEMGRLISRIRDTGVTVLLVEHDMSLVMKISDEVVVLSYGEKIAEDRPLAIQKNREVIRVYLGDDQ
jgi:branched-chain amino acid transport system ATP-binding protein